MRNLIRVLGLWALVGQTTHAAESSLLEVVPEGAFVAGAMRGSSLDLVHSYVAQSPEMQRDLSTALVQRLGVDLTRIDGVAFWAVLTGTKVTAAAFIRLPQSTATQLKGVPVGSFEGVGLVALDKLVAAAVPGGVLYGDEAQVRAGIAVAHHHAPALNAGSPLGSLLSQSGVDLLVGVAASAIADPTAQVMLREYGVRIVKLTVTADGRVVIVSEGDGAKLKNLAAIIDTTVKLALLQLKLQHDKALGDESMDFAGALGAVIAYDGGQIFWKEIAPKLEGDKLVSRYQLPQIKSASMFLPSLGVAAAIAIPAFMKYTRRSKSVEATMNVRKLAESAAGYAESAAPKQKARFTFPKSTEWTPAAGCCPRPGGKCAPDATLWSSTTFHALNFSVDDPFYYQYRVTSEGRGKSARITVEARGDLDCDQVTSSFKRTVTVDAQGHATVGPLESANDIE